ncbi:hypothetical protein ACTHP2_15400 [Bacillus altitudinis]|uniref:hypothetical protein n=1 Tax=Bacillus altitudinis TaxID=293387 RepID=UPI003F7B471F
MSAWIEISAALASSANLAVALYMSAWIEIANYRSVQVFPWCHFTRVRGLK